MTQRKNILQFLLTKKKSLRIIKAYTAKVLRQASRSAFLFYFLQPIYKHFPAVGRRRAQRKNGRAKVHLVCNCAMGAFVYKNGLLLS